MEQLVEFLFQKETLEAFLKFALACGSAMILGGKIKNRKHTKYESEQ